MMLKKKNLVVLLGMCMMMLVCGCEKGTGSESDIQGENVQTKREQTGLLSGEATLITGSGTSVAIEGNGAMEKGGIIHITSAGIYTLQGDFQNFQVAVEAQKDDVVQLDLNGVTMTNDNYAVINGVNCEKLILNSLEGTVNTLSDGSSYQLQSDDDEVNAVIFSKDDICLAGTGTLVINANYEDAVRSKDTLEILSGNYEVTSQNDAFQGKDEVIIFDGNFTVNAGNDAFKASNSTDEGKGNLTIEKGEFTVEAGDDAFHAEKVLTVNGGYVDIMKCYEGLEGIEVVINAGAISIVSSDDGINAAGGSDEGDDFFGKGGFGMPNEDAKVVINDGYVYVNASGDGIDSNGTLEVNGGILLIDGPTNGGNGALDYALSANVNGGYVLALGSGAMASGFSESSKQFSWHYQIEGMQGTKELLTVINEAGEVLVSYQSSKEYQSVVVSIPEFEKDSTYRIMLGGSIIESDKHGFSKRADLEKAVNGGSVVMENIVSGVSVNGFGGFGGGPGFGDDFEGGRGGKGNRGEMKRPEEGEMPELPEGEMKFPEGMEPPTDGVIPPQKPEDMEQN